MKIWLFAFCYNEERMLPFFLEHYEPWVDRMVFYDTGSTDQTLPILSKQPKVEIRSAPSAFDDADLSAYASREYKTARGRADIVVWVDFDEFLYPAQEIAQSSMCRPDGYQMLSDSFPQYGRPIVEQIRNGVRDKIYDKVCIINPNEEIVWRPGRHQCQIDLPHTSAVKLLHYRFLGEEYHNDRNVRNYRRMPVAQIEAGRGFQVYPSHKTGRYSLQWYKDRLVGAEQVI